MSEGKTAAAAKKLALSCAPFLRYVSPQCSIDDKDKTDICQSMKKEWGNGPLSCGRNFCSRAVEALAD